MIKRAGLAAVMGVVVSVVAAVGVFAQTTTQPAPIAIGGVAITPQGVLQARRVVATPAARRGGEPGLTYVSLDKAFLGWRAASEKGVAAPKELRYLQGLTRIEYVFVYPEAHDIVIAGPSEPFSDENPLQPVGRVSGRPVVQLEDLAVAMRAVAGQGARGGMQGGRHGGGREMFFGCSLDMVRGAQEIAAEVSRKFAGASSMRVADELKKALGPQQVRIIGVPEDTRVALAMVTADYRLKRMCIGLDAVPGVGNAVTSGFAANRVWFEPSYAPVGVTADGLNYRLSGSRLKVLAGPQDFDTRGATAGATAFAKRFSDKMPQVAAQVPAIADLQNVADLFVVAALVKQDGLMEKAGVDWAWVYTAGARVASLTVPKEAETLVNDTGTMIVQGGVAFAMAEMMAGERGSEKQMALRGRPEEGWFLTKARPAGMK